MDAFGISPAVQAVVEVLFRSMRQTGRTTARGRILLAFGSTPTEAATRAFCLARMPEIQQVPEGLK